MADESKKRSRTNSHGVTAPVHPRKVPDGIDIVNRSRERQIKRLAAKHKTAFSRLAKR